MVDDGCFDDTCNGASMEPLIHCDVTLVIALSLDYEMPLLSSPLVRVGRLQRYCQADAIVILTCCQPSMAGRCWVHTQCLQDLHLSPKW